MAILKNLESLRLGHPSVESVVYLDLNSGTVLGASSAIAQPQENFDALAELAKSYLGQGSSRTDEVVRIDATEALVFRRSPSDQDEVLCFVCAVDVDVTSVLDTALAALEAVEG